jgi:hypothetical protein
MPKADLVQTINQNLALRNGEFGAGGSVVQVTSLAMSSPFSGDFQIIDAGRLIVGNSSTSGGRVVASPSGFFGYDGNGVSTLALYVQDAYPFGAGDFRVGGISGNYLYFQRSTGTLGLYSGAEGAGFIADSDGSLYAGDTDGAHMRWDNASRSFQVRNAEDVKISLDANGDGFFDGTVYAQGGRIYGTMAVDGLLRVGDVDGPQVAMGRFERINDDGDLVETGEILATDASNLPWFHVVAGGETAGGGYFHLGATGQYAGRMTFDGVTLSVADWIVDSDRLRSPGGILNLSTTAGIQFIGIETTALLQDTGRMLTFWTAENDAWPTHRISAYLSDEAVDNHRLVIQAQPLSGFRASVYLSALSRQQGHVRVRAVGGYDTPSQQSTELDLWGYREEGGGTFTHRRIDLNTDITRLYAYTAATIPGGTIQNGSILHSDGTYNPGAGAGVYIYYGGYWVPVSLAGDATGWEAISTTATAGNVRYYTCSDAGGSYSITLPAATALPRNWQYTFKKSNSSANTITIDADGAATIDGAATYVLSKQHQFVTIRRAGANWDVIAKGDGATTYFGSATNYSQFDTTGHLTFAGTAKPWNDILVEPSARSTGANAPTFEKWYDDAAGTSRGVYLYSFDDAAGGSEKEVFFTLQMPHSWDGGDIQFHLHWVGAVADTTATPRWGLEYTWKEPGGTFGDTTIIYATGNHLSEADIVANKHYITAFTALSPGSTADDLSSVLIGRVFRDSANAADTYNATGAKCGLLYIDAHYQLARIGSTDEYTA